MWTNPVSWVAGAYGLYGLRLVVRGASDLLNDRRISRHNPTPLGEVRDGFVLTRGKVLPAGTQHRGPLSGTPCVLAHSRISDLERVIVQKTTSVPFLIEDETGRARVELTEGLSHISVARAWRRTVPESELDDRAQALWRPGYTVQERGRFQRTIELCEWMVFPGDEIYVLGQAELSIDVQGEAAGFREPPARPVLRGTSRHPLIVADGDRPSLRRAALRDLGRGAVGIAAGALGLAMW